MSESRLEMKKILTETWPREFSHFLLSDYAQCILTCSMWPNLSSFQCGSKTDLLEFIIKALNMPGDSIKKRS